MNFIQSLAIAAAGGIVFGLFQFMKHFAGNKNYNEGLSIIDAEEIEKNRILEGLEG